jgi:hypothetical protein
MSQGGAPLGVGGGSRRAAWRGGPAAPGAGQSGG